MLRPAHRLRRRDAAALAVTCAMAQPWCRPACWQRTRLVRLPRRWAPTSCAGAPQCCRRGRCASAPPPRSTCAPLTPRCTRGGRCGAWRTCARSRLRWMRRRLQEAACSLAQTAPRGSTRALWRQGVQRRVGRGRALLWRGALARRRPAGARLRACARTWGTCCAAGTRCAAGRAAAAPVQCRGWARACCYVLAPAFCVSWQTQDVVRLPAFAGRRRPLLR